MSSSPTDGATKSKTNLSLASLLSSAHGDHMAKNEKQNKLITSCTPNSENFYRGVSVVSSSIISRNLPTVANSELLYKSISSSRAESLSQMPPLAPTQPKMVFTEPPLGVVQPFSSSVSCSAEQVEEIYKQHGFLSYANVNNPLSHIKSLTNALTIPATQISQYQVINTISTTRPTPACSITLTQSHSSRLPISSTSYSALSSTFTRTVSPAPFISNGDMSISNIDTDDSSNYKCEVVCEGNIGNVNIEDCSSFRPDLVEQMSSFSSPTLEKKYRERELLSNRNLSKCEPVIVVPKGWNRILEKGVIIYISPNKSRIRSYDDMIEYMEADNTCKCGLECPVRPRELFNFDPKVSSKLGITDMESTCPAERNCNACKEFDILLSTSLAAKRVGRRRRRGRIKSTPEDDDKFPDRKKILLTGVSPLEMFQSGMQAINALSDSQFKNYTIGLEDCNSSSGGSKHSASLVNTFNTCISSMKSINKVASPTTNTSSIAQNLSNTLPGGAHSSTLPTNTALQNIVEFSGQTTLSDDNSLSNNSNNNDNDDDDDDDIDNSNNNSNCSNNNDNDNNGNNDNDNNGGNSNNNNNNNSNGSNNNGNNSNKNNNSNNNNYSNNNNNNNKNNNNNNNNNNTTANNNNANEGNQLNTLLANAIAFQEHSADLQTITSIQPVVASSPRSMLSNNNPINSVKRTGVTSPLLTPTSYEQTTSTAQITSSIQSHWSHAELTSIAAGIIRSESADVRNTKRVCKSGTRGRTKALDTYGLQTKKNVKKVLPNVDVKKACELQLSDYLRHPAYSITQGTVQPSSPQEIPSLKTIHSDVAFISRPQSANASLASNKSATTSELQNIYKSLHVQPSNLSSSSNIISGTSPPPNRTVSSTNQLPEALVNQLGLKFSSTPSSYPEKAFVTKVTSATNLKQLNASLPGRTNLQSSTTSSNFSIISAIQEQVHPEHAATTPTSFELKNKILNKPLQNITSSNVLHNNTISSNLLPTTLTDNGQQMLLLQFVTQNTGQVNNSTMTKVNAPIVCTYAVPQPQGYIQQCQPKYVLMEQSNPSQTHATLTMQSKSPISTTPPPNATKQTVHIQGLIPVQTNASELSPRGISVSHVVPHALPVQYVSSPVSIASQNSERTYPVIQYIQQQSKPDFRTTISNNTNNYVRIAPAVQSQSETVNIYNIENINNVQGLMKSSDSYSIIHQTTTSNAETLISKVTHSDMLSRNTPPPLPTEINNQHTCTPTAQVMLISNETATNITRNNLTPVTISNMHSVCHTEQLIPHPSVTCGSSSPVVLCAPTHGLNSSENVVFLSAGCSPSQTMMTTTNSSSTAAPYFADQVMTDKLDISEETLHCDENPADLLLSKEECAIYSTSPRLNASLDMSSVKAMVDSSFQPGDLVWVQITGYPSWPGRILSCFEAKKPKLNDGKVYVCWFGSNQISAVDVNQLKSFDEGFKGLDGNLTKRGYRANKKQLNELEKAVAAALEHSERKQGQLPVTLNMDFEER